MTPPAASESADLGAIILGYRDIGQAAGLAERLVAGGLDPSRVVVVLNAAGSTPPADAAYRQVRFPANLGYSAAMNAGLEIATDDGWGCVALLTQDVVVSCSELVGLAELLGDDDGLAVVAPLLVGRDREVFSGGGGLRSGGVFHRDAPDQALASVDWLDGAAWVARTAALEDIGGFDERYFLYVEDVDASLRLRKRGWRIAVSGAHRVVQEVGALRPERRRAAEYLITRNLLETYRKEGGQRMAAGLAVRKLRAVVTGRWPASVKVATLRGLRDYALRRFGPPPASVRSGSDIVL